MSFQSRDRKGAFALEFCNYLWLVKLARWQDKIQISGLAGEVPVWLCGWMRDPDTERAGATVVDWRYTEEEIGALCVECAVYFDRAIKPPRVVLHRSSRTKRLRR